MPLTLTALPGIPDIRKGDRLGDIILSALPKANISLMDDDIFVLAQKIVSKAEGRLIDLTMVRPSKSAVQLASRSSKDPRLCELIIRESQEILRVRPGTIIVVHRLGFVCANAGIDRSNVIQDLDETETVLLLPEDPDHSALSIVEEIGKVSKKNIGVLIIDSHGRAWRNGVAGTCIGIACVPAIIDLRGHPDLYGRKLKITQIAAADELAAAASLVMGQAAEGTPVIHVRGFPYPLGESSTHQLIRPKDQDLFR